MRERRIETPNDRFQILLSLATNRRKRKDRGLILVESVAAVDAALEAALRVESVAVPSSRKLSRWAQGVLDRAAPEELLRLSDPLFADLSARSDPSELLLVVRYPERTLESVALSACPLVLVFDRPTNHGNLGSVQRSADAFGVELLITTGHGVDLWDPAVIRSSLGACFRVPTVHEPSAERLVSLLDGLRGRCPGFTVIATDSTGAVPLPEAAPARPLALVMGNEADGVSARLLEYADRTVAIPMGGGVDSLNVACAATVFLYEIARNSVR